MVKKVIKYEKGVQYVCQTCGKDLGTANKVKGTAYFEPKGGWYCDRCYKKRI